ncbi:HI_0552 family protein [Streptococcus merionis]|uniref:HI_0552 family protein n=1 Tax=Streptococcus merionis TaxID=400065 RepID=UPI0035184FA4
MDYQEKLQAIRDFIPYQGDKYISPGKAGVLASQMEAVKTQAQQARMAFTDLAKSFEKQVFDFQLQRTSQWMNQAQILRPHFWVYLIEKSQSVQSPALALRLLNDVSGLGISLEVSLIERQKNETTLYQQNQVLTVAPHSELYYFAQIEGTSRRFPMTEANRLGLTQGIETGQVRKVQVKFDIPDLTVFSDESSLLAELKRGWLLLQPYYRATKIPL